jgi:hypothetical protein
MKKKHLYIYIIFLYCITILLTSCTTGEQFESGSDNTGTLHHVRHRLYKRNDSKISLKEQNGHEDFLDTLTIEAEEVDTLLFKTSDISLNLLAKDLSAENSKSTRLIIKNNFKKFFFKSKNTIKLPKDAYISVAYLCNNRGVAIKTRHAIKVYGFKVIEEKQPSLDKEQPMIFITKPTPYENGMVILDFILVNMSLTEENNLIRVTIDGIDFFADKWVPFLIHGLKPGKHKIEVAIVSNDDQELDNYFSKDSREFTLK